MYARTHRRALTLLLAALGMVSATTLIPAPAQAAPPCSITYRAGGWDASGTSPASFHGEFDLTNNTATKTVGWRVEVHYAAGVELTQHWNSVLLLDVDPVYVFGNDPSNFEIPPNGRRAVWFDLFARKTANNISNYPVDAVCTPLF